MFNGYPDKKWVFDVLGGKESQSLHFFSSEAKLKRKKRGERMKGRERIRGKGSWRERGEEIERNIGIDRLINRLPDNDF